MNVIHLPHEKDEPQMALAAIDEPVEVREVRAVRGLLPLERTTPMDKDERRTVFALGACAGVAVSLCLFAVLSPNPASSLPSMADELVAPESVVQRDFAMQAMVVPDVAMVLPAIVIPGSGVLSSHAIASVPVPGEGPLSAVAPPPARPLPASPMTAAPTTSLPVAPASAAPVAVQQAQAPTVLYRASAPDVARGLTVKLPVPVATPAPVMPDATVDAIAAASKLALVSIPSASLALIGSQVDGNLLVSPYKVGQALPDGRVITAIDPAKGIVKTSDGQLSAEHM